MTLHWRQAPTSAIVGAVAAIAAVLLLHGSIDRERLGFALAIGLAIGASRLIELRK